MQDDEPHLQLFLAHRAALIDYATPLVGDRMRAEDVVQEAFLRFGPAVRAGGARAIEQPVGYLYRIVRNLALDWARRRPLEARHVSGEGPHWLRPAVPRTPEQELAHRQELERVAALLAELPDATRLALEMHRFGGYTLQEIATRLGISVTGAHRLVRQALLHLALGLEADS